MENGVGKIAMRIEDGDTFAGNDVLDDQVEQQRALSGTGLADDIEMPPPCLTRERHVAAVTAGAKLQVV